MPNSKIKNIHKRTTEN